LPVDIRGALAKLDLDGEPCRITRPAAPTGLWGSRVTTSLEGTLPLFWHVLPRLVTSAAILVWGGASARRAVRTRLGDAPWDVVLLGAASVFALALTLPALLLGACGQLREWTWALGAIAAFAIVRWAPFGEPAALLGDTSAPSAPFLVAIGGTTLGRMAFSLRNPPADWDSFHYHLPMIAAWMQSGSLGVPMHSPAPFGQYFPGGGELLETWMAWSTGRDTLISWVGILGLAVLALATARLSRVAGAHPAVAEAAALGLAGAPGVMQLTMGAKVDHLLAAWFAIALLFAFRFRENGRRAELAIAIATLGLVPGVKSTGPVYAAMVLLVALVGRGFGARWRALLASRAAIGVAIVSGGFWYARNALAAGNPLYPAELIVGGRELRGLMGQEALRRTMQAFVWMEGHGGHLTIRNALRYYGPGLGGCALGVLAWLALAAPRLVRAPRPHVDQRGAAFAALAFACAVFYLFTPFSGLYLPAERETTLYLNFDNLRLLLPTGIAVTPVAAAGLSALGAPISVALAIGALWFVGMGAKLSHIGPGIALAGTIWIVRRTLRRGGAMPHWPAVRLAAIVVSALALAWAVARVDPLREKGEAMAWDGHLTHIHNLPWARLREVRAEAAGRPVATAGVASWWGVYGRDFSGHPVYVPVEMGWEASQRPYHLRPEARRRPSAVRWRDNLARSNAAFVIVGALDDSCEVRFPEDGWCRGDPAHFEAVDSMGCSAVYRVLGPARAGAASPPAANVAGRLLP
jgi:hypothetical protein